MRLRLEIQRQELPTVKILWHVPPGPLTFSKFLERVNEIIPLESDGWGLDDYMVHVKGFECLHYSDVHSHLSDNDEVTIRPLQTPDIRERSASGRYQISSAGAHLIDGIPFGRSYVKSPNRPGIYIPPRKRPRHTYDSGAGLEAQKIAASSEIHEQLAITETPYENPIDSVVAAIVETGPPGLPVNQPPTLDSTTKRPRTRERDAKRTKRVSFDENSLVANVDGGLLNGELNEESEEDEEDDDFVAHQSDSGSSSSSSSSDSEESSDGESSNDDDSDSSSGASDDGGENQNQDRNQEDGSKASDDNSDLESDSPDSSSGSSSSSAKKHSLPAKSKKSRPKDAEVQVPVSQHRGIPFQGSKDTKSRNERRSSMKRLNALKRDGIIEEAVTLKTFRDAGLLDLFQNHAQNISLEDKKRKVSELLEAYLGKNHNESQVEAVDINNSTASVEEQDSVRTPRSRLDLESSRRLLFGSLGLRVPKTKADEDKLREKLSTQGKRNSSTVSSNHNTDPKPNTIASHSHSGGSNQPDDGVNAWKSKIKLSAVECCEDGITLSTPPFPFQQRWDPQQHYRKNSKKRKRSSVNDESMDDTLSYSMLDYDEPKQHGTEETDLPALPSTLSALPTLQRSDIDENATIAFKQLEVSEATSWQPAISAYRTALVNAFDSDTGLLTLTLAKRDRPKREIRYDEFGTRVYGKFEMAAEVEDEPLDGADGQLEISFDEMMEPILVAAASTVNPAEHEHFLTQQETNYVPDSQDPGAHDSMFTDENIASNQAEAGDPASDALDSFEVASYARLMPEPESLSRSNDSATLAGLRDSQSSSYGSERRSMIEASA